MSKPENFGRALIRDGQTRSQKSDLKVFFITVSWPNLSIWLCIQWIVHYSFQGNCTRLGQHILWLVIKLKLSLVHGNGYCFHNHSAKDCLLVLFFFPPVIKKKGKTIQIFYYLKTFYGSFSVKCCVHKKCNCVLWMTTKT